MKKFIVIREVKPDIFEKRVNDLLDEGKYKLINSGATNTIGYWAYMILKEE